jgi:glutamate decarboxylase
MVHLATVDNDSDAQAPLIKELENVKIREPDENELTETVYGSRWAAEGLPSSSMPESEM